jgi:lysine-ketoglutarate reductase/saccharopine dehydrogenase-like protein (TIGR00300 family)
MQRAALCSAALGAMVRPFSGRTVFMPSEVVSLEGHIIDSLTLSKVLDIILRDGGQYRIVEFHIGGTRSDMSRARIQVSAPDTPALERILHLIQQHGAARADGDCRTEPAPADGVFPEEFYVTTNLETSVRVAGKWVPVEPIEMDCGIVLRESAGGIAARCTPMHQVRAGDLTVVGVHGIHVAPPERRDPNSAFRFMGSEVSTERSKERTVAAIAETMRETHQAGKRILFVGGPAILHTGAGRWLEALLRAGWIDVLFAGNALATHDIEHALYGTSLGVDLKTGQPLAHGHENHLRAINRIRAAGSIANAVAQGILTSGVLHACVQSQTPFVLAGSIRDDGPLPDVLTDTLRAQDAMRAQLQEVGMALMVATTLHSVATGNLLPASVRTICVDTDADTVIKLMDRGTHQAFGLVTDCEFFLKELAAQLVEN